MTFDAARSWIIKASLGLTAAIFAFLVLAPLLGYPLDAGAGDVVRLLEILLPVFVGYLGSAAHFVFRAHASDGGTVLHPNAVLLVKGPLVVWVGMTVVAFVAFGAANRASAPPGAGMSVDMLAGLMTAALSLLTATTNVAIAYLFSKATT